jgi:hypothetical protein
VPAPPFFFVEVGAFHRPIRHSTVIVNNTTIINKTTVIGGVSAQTKTFDGARPQKVMFNAGPNVADIQKVTGTKVQTVSVHEATRQTQIPRTMEHKMRRDVQGAEQKARDVQKETTPAIQEPSGSKIQKPVPRESVTPEKPKAPEKSAPAIKEPSGSNIQKPAPRESVTPEKPKAREKPVIREPSGAKSETPQEKPRESAVPEKPKASEKPIEKPAPRENVAPNHPAPPSEGKPHGHEQAAPVPRGPGSPGGPHDKSHDKPDKGHP